MLPSPRVALAVAVLVLAACSGRVWSAGQLAERHPSLADHPGHRLAEMHPYVFPRAGAVWLLRLGARRKSNKLFGGPPLLPPFVPRAR